VDAEISLHLIYKLWGEYSLAAWREWRGVFAPQHAAADSLLTDEGLHRTRLRFVEVVIGCAAVKGAQLPGRIGISYYTDNLHVLRVLARHVRPESGVPRESIDRALRYWAGKRCRAVVMELVTLAMKLRFDLDFTGLEELGIGEEWLWNTRVKTNEWAAEPMPSEFSAG
jgi:hypothetical protein